MHTILLRFAAPGAAALLLAACSVATPPAVNAVSGVAEPLAALRLETPAPADPASARFTAALATALDRRGIAISADSPTVLSVALSQRPAAMGVTARPGETWLSAPRRKGPFDACRAQRIAVRLVARHEARPEPDFTASGGFDYCKLAPAELDALAERFAAEIARSPVMPPQR